jgi:hypothetical protein
MYIDSVPALVCGKGPAGIIVTMTRGDDCDLVSGVSQTPGNASQLLGRRHDVRPETLIE